MINGDKNAASSKAITDLKASEILPAAVELRQINSLNHLMEQDHRFIKRLVTPGMGFFSCETAWRTLQGYEIRNLLRKGQAQEVKKGDTPNHAAFIAHLFEVPISAEP